MKLMKKAAVNLTTLQGRRQWGSSGAQPPFKICVPHFMFSPWLVHTSNIVFKKFGPACGFWPHLLRNPGDGLAILLLHIY